MNSKFINDLSLNRRQALKASLAFGGMSLGGMSAFAAGSATAAAATKGKLDYSDPRDNLYAFGKIWSSFDEPCIDQDGEAFHKEISKKSPEPHVEDKSSLKITCGWQFLTAKTIATAGMTLKLRSGKGEFWGQFT